MESTPPLSTIFAVVKSYAVSMVIFSPSNFILRKVSVVIFLSSECTDIVILFGLKVLIGTVGFNYRIWSLELQNNVSQLDEFFVVQYPDITAFRFNKAVLLKFRNQADGTFSCGTDKVGNLFTCK